jgi:hypothetical protein
MPFPLPLPLPLPPLRAPTVEVASAYNEADDDGDGDGDDDNGRSTTASQTSSTAAELRPLRPKRGVTRGAAADEDRPPLAKQPSSSGGGRGGSQGSLSAAGAPRAHQHQNYERRPAAEWGRVLVLETPACDVGVPEGAAGLGIWEDGRSADIVFPVNYRDLWQPGDPALQRPAASATDSSALATAHRPWLERRIALPGSVEVARFYVVMDDPSGAVPDVKKRAAAAATAQVRA